MIGLPGIDIVLFFALVFISSVVTAASAAIESASRNKLELIAQDGDARASVCLALKSNSETVHAAVFIINAFLVVSAGAVVIPDIHSWLLAISLDAQQAYLMPAARVLALGAGAVCIAGISIVSSALVARSLGMRYAEAISLKSARTMRLVTRLMRPPQIVLQFAANILLRPFGAKARFGEAVMSEESLMDALEEGTRTGLLDRTEHELIENIFEFTTTTAREIMIPRTDIVAIDFTMTPEQILEKVAHEGFTRLPVYKESIDNIIGVIYSKDVLSIIEHRDLIILQDIIRPPFVVPETKPIPELLREFQRKRIHLAVVVDEFGGTEGIITLEDILEEIVGEIRDEYDDDSRLFELLPGGVVEVEGRMNISDLNEHVEFVIPESDDYDTVGGFVTTLMGRIPAAGDTCDFHRIVVEVLNVDERRVTRVRFRPPAGEQDAGEE
jgi:CBS domain containing-hemolysin-like protein